MTLITPAGEAENAYSRFLGEADALPSAEGAIIVPLTLAGAAVASRRNAPLGLSVPNDADVEAIAGFFGAVDLIAVEFPSFSDGRGLSLARRLRRAGFAGRLRASGPLIADQFAEALACGFDEVELPAEMAKRQPVEQWMAAKDIVSDHYQNGYGAGESILRKRLSARKGPTL